MKKPYLLIIALAFFITSKNTLLEALKYHKAIKCQEEIYHIWSFAKDSIFIYDDSMLLEFDIKKCSVVDI